MHEDHYGDLISPKQSFVVVYTKKINQGAFMVLKGSYKGNLCAVKVCIVMPQSIKQIYSFVSYSGLEEKEACYY